MAQALFERQVHAMRPLALLRMTATGEVELTPEAAGEPAEFVVRGTFELLGDDGPGFTVTVQHCASGQQEQVQWPALALESLSSCLQSLREELRAQRVQLPEVGQEFASGFVPRVILTDPQELAAVSGGAGGALVH